MAGTVSHIQTRNAALYVIKSALTFDSATSLDQEYSTSNIFKVKNLDITPPMSEVELINLWGSDVLDTLGAGVSTTGTFQVQATDEKSWTLAKASFTVVFSHDELGVTTAGANNHFEYLFHGAGIDITDTPAFTRFTYGDQVTSTRILVGNIGFVFNNGSGIANVNMANVTVTKMGGIKPTGADGHFEQEVEVVCLAKDFSHEKED